jgi:hypothetical protein
MSESNEDLEQLIQRPPRRDIHPPWETTGTDARGHCRCGARITDADVYAGGGGADLGRPRRRPAPRLLRYRCPLCGCTGELPADEPR